MHKILKTFKRFENGGPGRAQSVERATSGQEVVGSIPAPGARSLLVSIIIVTG